MRKILFILCLFISCGGGSGSSQGRDIVIKVDFKSTIITKEEFLQSLDTAMQFWNDEFARLGLDSAMYIADDSNQANTFMTVENSRDFSLNGGSQGLARLCGKTLTIYAGKESLARSQVVAHELGHIVGGKHVTCNTGCIMGNGGVFRLDAQNEANIKACLS